MPESNRRAIRPLARSARRAAALLEVVIALSVLLVCMSVIGIIFSNGTYYIERAEELARADIMTERLIGQIETGITALSAGETIGDFGEEGPPGMNFRVVVNPDKDLPDLLRVDIDVFMGNPAEDDNAKLVTTTHLLRAAPKGIDFARDFGFDEEQLAKVTEAVPGGEAVLDVNNFDPRSLASLDLDMLVQLLPTLMQALGGNLGAGDLSSLLQAAANGDTSMIQQLTQGLQNAQQGGDGKPGAPPGGPPPGDAGPGDGQPPPPPRGRGEADPDGRPDRGGPPPNFDGGRGDDGRGDGEARPPRRGGGQDPNNPDGRGGGGRRGGGGGRRGGGQ